MEWRWHLYRTMAVKMSKPTQPPVPEPFLHPTVSIGDGSFPTPSTADKVIRMRRHRFRNPILLLAAATLLPITSAVAHQGEHPGGEVMLVATVVPGSAADKAGLVAGDRILTWDGRKITTQEDLSAFLDSHQPGDEIPLILTRDGETLELPLTFGTRADGGVSVGLSLGIAGQSTSAEGAEGFTAAECLMWVDDTYRMASMAQGFGLELASEIAEIRACMDHDTRGMAQPIPQTWCDNVFKIHCSGLDLLAEIGDAQVARCEEELGTSLGVDLSRNREWNTCGEQKVFDRYSMRGEASDEATCRRILIEECGAEIED